MPTIQEAMELLKKQREETEKLLSGSKAQPEDVKPPTVEDGEGIVGTAKQLKKRKKMLEGL
jgi:hypothetical protein